MSWLTAETGEALFTQTGVDILLESGPVQPLQAIIPSYLYEQFSDDSDLNAFVAAFNALAQAYLDWFNATPLAIYTNPNIAGPLLDWIARGIYGIERPVFSSQTTRYIAGLNASALNTKAVDGQQYLRSGTATIATDDFYKRVLTWWLYAGPSRRFNAAWLRARVARFLYGVNGTDVTLNEVQRVSIQPESLPPPPPPTLTGTAAGGAIPARVYGARVSYVTPIGEGLAGGASSLSVPYNHLLGVASPPTVAGAIGWNVYAGILSTNPGNFSAGLNSGPVDGKPVNGTNKRGVAAPTRQNAAPIAIGANWTEPVRGLIPGSAMPTQDGSNKPGNFIVLVPAGTEATELQQAFAQGLLAFPFMLTATIAVMPTTPRWWRIVL